MNVKYCLHTPPNTRHTHIHTHTNTRSQVGVDFEEKRFPARNTTLRIRDIFYCFYCLYCILLFVFSQTFYSYCCFFFFLCFTFSFSIWENFSFSVIFHLQFAKPQFILICHFKQYQITWKFDIAIKSSTCWLILFDFWVMRRGRVYFKVKDSEKLNS